MVDELKAISMHLAGAAKYGSATAHRLAGIANGQVAKIDDANPMESTEVLQGISALTKMANESSTIGLTLLAANRDAMKQASQDQPVLPVRVFVRVEDASRPEPKAQQAAG